MLFYKSAVGFFRVCFGVGNLRLVDEGEVKFNSFSSNFRPGSAAGFFGFRLLIGVCALGAGRQFLIRRRTTDRGQQLGCSSGWVLLFSAFVWCLVT
jgi:hypothetical protein